MRMKTAGILVLALGLGIASITACKKSEGPAAQAPAPPQPQWTDLFAPDLSNAVFPAGIWTVSDGVLTDSEDQAIWTNKAY